VVGFAASEEIMPENRPWDVITFDCYGTLIDWEAGISDAFREAAAADGVKLDPAAALRAVSEREPEIQAAQYRSYREVLTVTAMEVAARLGWTVSRERAAFLPDSLPRWKPFPDTNAALERLSRAGYELGILSNVDDDLLAGTRRHFTVSFPLLVTAQQVRSYKPAPGHFTTARERIGGRRWLHAAQSYFHDITPAVAHRVPVAWINRKSMQPTGAARADRELRTLTELADWLA
jgi:2-haloacid dehalogenase/putative hydrolase of the HAD superfamily